MAKSYEDSLNRMLENHSLNLKGVYDLFPGPAFIAIGKLSLYKKKNSSKMKCFFKVSKAEAYSCYTVTRGIADKLDQKGLKFIRVEFGGISRENCYIKKIVRESYSSR